MVPIQATTLSTSVCNVARSIATTKLWDTMSNPKSPHDVVHRQPLKRFAIELKLRDEVACNRDVVHDV